MDFEKIVQECVEKIKILPTGEVFVFNLLFSEHFKKSGREEFELFRRIMDKLKEEQINVENCEPKGAIIGLPYTFRYKKINK